MIIYCNIISDAYDIFAEHTIDKGEEFYPGYSDNTAHCTINTLAPHVLIGWEQDGLAVAEVRNHPGI